MIKKTNVTNALEKANFKSLIEEGEKSRLQDKMNVAEVFLGTEKHVTLEELNQLLKKNGYDYDYDFVHQCMNRLVRLGFAQRKHFEGQPVRYEHRHLGIHHDHFICTKCGKIVEFINEELEVLQAKIAAQHGFYILQHQMDIYGLCVTCLNRRRPLIPLSMTKTGEQVELKEIVEKRGVRERLSDMGLRLGDQIEIINNSGRGKIILGRGYTRLAIGRGLAQKIMIAIVGDK